MYARKLPPKPKHHPQGQHTGEYDLLFSQSASRALAAWLIDLSAGELIARNAAVSIPDMDPDSPDTAAAVRLYQAGVLTGVDAAGNFAPDASLTRAQAAVIFARILDPGLRVTV